MQAKLRAPTVILGFVAVMEYLALSYWAGAEIVIEYWYPSDCPFKPEIYYALVLGVAVSVVSAVLTFNAMKLRFASQCDDAVDIALRWTFLIAIVALPVGILVATPTLFLATPFTVVLPFKLGSFLRMPQHYCNPTIIQEIPK